MRVANCVQGSSAVAIYAALFFDPRGRPGPRRCLRRRRPFFACGAVETLPSNDRIAERTSCCTKSRITVNKLLCLGIDSSLLAADTRTLMPRKGGTICWASSGESCWGGGHLHASVRSEQARRPRVAPGNARWVRFAFARASRGRGAFVSCAPRSGAADDVPPPLRQRHRPASPARWPPAANLWLPVLVEADYWRGDPRRGPCGRPRHD